MFAKRSKIFLNLATAVSALGFVESWYYVRHAPIDIGSRCTPFQLDSIGEGV
jgi:hypothetical protein